MCKRPDSVPVTLMIMGCHKLKGTVVPFNSGLGTRNILGTPYLIPNGQLFLRQFKYGVPGISPG